MEGIFRSQDDWKSAMMTLPDDVFFDLLRSVFGHIKTPFNKQNLLADLEAFLSRDEVRENMAAYIDDEDAQVIAAVAMLHNPPAGELERFFAGTGPELSVLLPNLEERFILYRFRDGPALRLGLNPLLEPLLGPIAADPRRVLPSTPLSGEKAGPGGLGDSVPFDDRTLGALFSLVLGEGNIFRIGSRPRKKTMDAAKRIFPAMDLEAASRCLLCLGLCRMDGGESPVPDDHALRGFGALEPRHRQIYWAAGLAVAAETSPELLQAPQLLRGRVRSLARLIDRLLGLLEPGRLYPGKTLGRLLHILERDEEGPGDPAAMDAPMLWAALVQAGLLRQGPQGCCLADAPATDAPAAGDPSAADPSAADPSADPPAAAEKGRALLAMDTPFSCVVYPGVSFTDALALASFSTVRETGAVFRFELTRESCLRGFERGAGAADMEALLVRLSGKPMEDSLLWTLRDWERRSTEVSLIEGAILCLAPERRYLAETEDLAALIRRELAPGLYLLSSGLGAAEALRKAGVDIFTHLAGPPAASPLEDSGPPRPWGFPPLGKVPPPAWDRGAPGGSDSPPEKAEDLKVRFRSALGDRTLSAAERSELAARIERRLVLAESQLIAGSVRAEKLEARGLDYVGKASIAKQAINSRSLVEALWSSAEDGAEQRILAIPQALEKSGEETVLVIGDAPHTLRIPLGKISLLRRIKKSIFEFQP
ncbi:MAG: hypothetical protein LBQ46_13795 [Treponema sp.]|jgi:hypothetical protein|nr:hypothetical protein [Treponema sp.]